MAIDPEFMVALAMSAFVAFACIVIWAFITCVLEDTSYED